jgi:DNA-binding NarL/FixJ family response regulator
MAIRILFADDHKILREALKGVLEREHDIALVGEANDGAEAKNTTSRWSEKRTMALKPFGWPEN